NMCRFTIHCYLQGYRAAVRIPYNTAGRLRSEHAYPVPPQHAFFLEELRSSRSGCFLVRYENQTQLPLQLPVGIADRFRRIHHSCLSGIDVWRAPPAPICSLQDRIELGSLLGPDNIVVADKIEGSSASIAHKSPRSIFIAFRFKPSVVEMWVISRSG